jgi:predicted nucleic acid-binding protein
VPIATAAKVVDASAIAAVLFGEPEAESLARRLNSGSLRAPALLPFEVASACLKKARRDPVQAEAIIGAYSLLATMAIELTPVDHREVLDLARTSRLSVYDASYLWLARELDAELITLDRKLAAAMARS